LTPKRLSLLKEVVPAALRVGVLLRDDWPNTKPDWQTGEEAARQLGLELVALNASSADDLAAALSEAAAWPLAARAQQGDRIRWDATK
jgi:putative ABC transport system substrate-binding protein